MNTRKLVCFTLLIVGGLFADEAPEGLRLQLNSGGQSTVKVTPNVHLFLREGSSASPLIPAGQTKAEWTGYVNADLRGDFKFKALVRGQLSVELNEKEILSGEGGGKDGLGPSDEIRLNKGPNKLRVRFESPAKGDGFLRLLWSEYGFLWEPIHRSQLTRDANDEALTSSNQLLRGRDLFIEGRCVRCHRAEGEGIPDLSMDAPSFVGIGSRRHAPWMAKWILNPKAERSSAEMPVVLHGGMAAKDAEAIAAFLGSLKGEAGLAGKSRNDGESLVEMFHCTGCHNLPGQEVDAAKLSLDHVNEKFPPGQLAAFLMNPTKHYQWRRMPDFDMSKEEAVTVAAYLRSHFKMVKAKQPDAALIPRGKKLVQETGCLNCHQMDLPNQHQTKSLAKIAGSSAGCLSVKAGGAPSYSFDKESRQALVAFLQSDRNSLTRHVPVEFSERHSRNLRCTACHGELEGFPPLERLGGKLKPEFMHEFISGKTNYKPRPWLNQVMPAFPAYAAGLAHGLAHSHGYSDKTAPESKIDEKAAKIGRQMTGVNGGFSCVACHGVGDLQPTQVFEAEGINLSLPARRLQKDYYLRWILNPLKIEPQTKMPVYFDEEGNSMLYDVLEGKTMKQVEAMWQYMRMGDKIDPPKMEGF
ncbi:MAG: c-type cytochrome [Limisphaerales bacterium]